MTYEDPKARRDGRVRVNLNHYEIAAVNALAKYNRMQPATYAAEILRNHLNTFKTPQQKNAS